jgi:hypothetical protein
LLCRESPALIDEEITVILLGITSSWICNPWIGDSYVTDQSMDDESTRGWSFFRKLRAHERGIHRWVAHKKLPAEAQI